jgi:hypothetical protein
MMAASVVQRSCLDTRFHPKFHYAKRRFPVTSKCRYMFGVLNIDEIKKLITSLINQCLDNYYQIKTKLLQYYTVFTVQSWWYLNKPKITLLCSMLYAPTVPGELSYVTFLKGRGDPFFWILILNSGASTLSKSRPPEETEDKPFWILVQAHWANQDHLKKQRMRNIFCFGLSPLRTMLTMTPPLLHILFSAPRDECLWALIARCMLLYVLYWPSLLFTCEDFRRKQIRCHGFRRN